VGGEEFVKTFESRMRELVHTEMTSESPDGNGGSLQITETTIPMQSVADALAIAQEADQAVAELRTCLLNAVKSLSGLPSRKVATFQIIEVLEGMREVLERTNE
jgi:hypothetical protein